MKIEIKLDNYKWCDGCIALVEEYYNCECRYRRGFMESMHEDKCYEYSPRYRRFTKYGRGHYMRPKDCIKDNGK